MVSGVGPTNYCMSVRLLDELPGHCKTHDHASSFDLASEVGVLTQEAITRVNEVNIVFLCDLDDLVTGKVGSDGCVFSSLANDIGLVGLLSVHRQAVLMTVDGYCLERKLVCGTENTDGDFTTVGDCVTISNC